MGFFDMFKKNKENGDNEENSNDSFLENYLKSKFIINSDKIDYSSNDIARIERNCDGDVELDRFVK